MNATDKPQTIEKTSKKYKLRLLLAALMMIAAVPWYIVVKNNANVTGVPANFTGPGVLFGVGILIWIQAKIAIWWNHG